MNTSDKVSIVLSVIALMLACAGVAEYTNYGTATLSIAKDGTTNWAKRSFTAYFSTYSNGFLDSYVLSNDTVVFRRVAPSAKLFPPSGSENYEKSSVTLAKQDIKQKQVTLLTLVNNSDLVAVGTVETQLMPHDRFVIEGENIAGILVFRVRDIIGAVWDDAALTNRIITAHNCSNIIYILEHPATMEVRAHDSTGLQPLYDHYDPPLCAGGTYLLWLKQYPMDVADAGRYELEGQSMFKTVLGQKGAVLVSDVKELLSVAPQSRYLYENNSKLMREIYNTTNTSVIVEAARRMVHGMRFGAEVANRHKDFDLCGAALRLSLINKTDDLQWDRYRTVDKKLP